MVCTPHHSAGDGVGGEEVPKTNPLWYVGVILGIASSVATNLGVNLQKYSFMREAKRSIKLKRGYLRQPLWVIGLLLVIGGSLLDFAALSFVPQSLETPVGGSAMIANVVFASLILKEKFTRMDAIGTGLVLAGICIVAAFANKESACYTVDELVALYGEPFFVMYLVIVALACLGLFLLAKKLERVLRLQGSSSTTYKKYARVHPVTYPALSGVFGAQSVLFAKSVAELFKTTLEGTNQFTNIGTYLISLSMLACIFLQIHWLAHGLQLFDAVFIVPVFQCFFISTSIFGGGVYFKEFAAMSTFAVSHRGAWHMIFQLLLTGLFSPQLIAFFIGAIVTLWGVVLLSRREMNVLKPSGKLRAAVKMIMFIKRTQKACNIDHRWVQQPSRIDSKSGSTNVVFVKALARQPSLSMGGKTSKASVRPIDSNNSDTSTPQGQSMYQQIQTSPKRLDK
jgi:magnesium transporter